ncbi:MAG: AAA family ATPase [Actinomycetia bacterium]|nr:AAA family ATPase [Actinomycetes bacterium]
MAKIEKLDRAEVKMMLNYVGIPLREQPSKTSELRELLKAFQKTNSEKYEESYKFVVEQKSDSTIERTVPISDASKIVSEEIGLLKESALSVMDEVYRNEGNKLLTKITDTFEKAVETESKKFNLVKHVVYNGEKEFKELEGTVCENFETLLQLCQERVNVLMVGPAGCGKTHVAAQISEAMDLPFASQSCSAGVSESVFTGKLLPLGDHGKFEYVESDFVRIYEQGGVFLFDEIDAADANVLVFLNQSLANGSFHCAQRIGNTLVKKHKDFIAIGAANTFGSGADSLYTGRNSLDAATLDRFRMGTIPMDYSPTVEEAIVNEEVLEYGRKMRKLISKNKLMKIISTRFLKDATAMKVGQKWSMEKIQDMYLADWSKEEISIIGGKLNFSNSQNPGSKSNSNDSILDKAKTIGNFWQSKDGLKKRVYFNNHVSGKDFWYDVNSGKFDTYGLHDTTFDDNVKVVTKAMENA